MNDLVNGDIVNALGLEGIIALYGCGTVEIDGDYPEAYHRSKELGMNGFDYFHVVINYGYPVQFHLISDITRVIITTGLLGKV